MSNSTRTQIILPKDLRGEIEKARRAARESLAEYLRKAVRERLEKEKKKKINLELLARRIGTVKKSGWEGLDAVEWQRIMREDRSM